MGIQLIEGRDFTLRDIVENPKIAIVNQKFAQHFFKDKCALGRRIGRGLGPETKLDIEIVGVVQDSLYEGPREGVRRQVSGLATAVAPRSTSGRLTPPRPRST